MRLSFPEISHEKATEKANLEYRQYKAKNLSEVEEVYLQSIKSLEKKIDKKVKAEKPTVKPKRKK